MEPVKTYYADCKANAAVAVKMLNHQGLTAKVFPPKQGEYRWTISGYEGAIA